MWQPSRHGGFKRQLPQTSIMLRDKSFRGMDQPGIDEPSVIENITKCCFVINVHYHLNFEGDIVEERLCVCYIDGLMDAHPNILVS